MKTAAPALYPVFFATVFFMNVFFALDGYREARDANTVAGVLRRA